MQTETHYTWKRFHIDSVWKSCSFCGYEVISERLRHHTHAFWWHECTCEHYFTAKWMQNVFKDKNKTLSRMMSVTDAESQCLLDVSCIFMKIPLITRPMLKLYRCDGIEATSWTTPYLVLHYLQQRSFINTPCVCLISLTAIQISLLLNMYDTSWREESDDDNFRLLNRGKSFIHPQMNRVFL